MKTITNSKVAKITVMSLVIISLVFSLAACGGDDSKITETGDYAIIGIWEMEISMREEFGIDLKGNTSFEFKKDNTVDMKTSFDISELDQEELELIGGEEAIDEHASLLNINGDYEIDGNRIKITFDLFGESIEIEWKFKIDGNKLTTTDSEGNVEVYTKK